MERQVSATIAAKLVEATDKLEEIVDYMHQNLESNERAPFLRTIGEVFAILSEEFKSRLVVDNPELHELLFRGLPREWPQQLLQTSRYRSRTNSE